MLLLKKEGNLDKNVPIKRAKAAEISRRDLFKLGGVTVAGIAGAKVLTACTSAAQTDPEESEADGFVDSASVVGGSGYNILFITTDQEHYFNSFPEGTNYRARKRLMELGTTFEKNYICSNVSSSSRSVIYTGRHITETEVHDNLDFAVLQQPMDPSVKTIGTMLRELGYYTAFKGKSHFTGCTTNPESALIPPNDSDESLALPQTQNEMEPYGFSDWNPDGDYPGGPWQGYSRDATITSSSIQWLRTSGSSLNKKGTPFFLAVNLINPHDIMYTNVDTQNTDDREEKPHLFPIAKPPENALYAQSYPEVPLEPGALEKQDLASLPQNHTEFRLIDEASFGLLPQNEEEWHRFQDYYFNTIQDNDDCLNLLLEELKALGMMRNTIIVFTSDHGDMCGAHGLRGKGGFIYENNIHVPLIVVHPVYPGGSRVEALTSSLDLVPTLVDFATVSLLEKESALSGVSGSSLVPLLENPQADIHSIRPGALFLFSDLQMMDSAGIAGSVSDSTTGETGVGFIMDIDKRGVVRAVVEGRYKFARYFAPSSFNTPLTFEELIQLNDIELYDLQEDPNEMHNLAADLEKNKELILKMNELLNRMIAEEVGVDNGNEFARLPVPGGFAGLLSRYGS